jgi:hypothetical protein
MWALLPAFRGHRLSLSSGKKAIIVRVFIELGGERTGSGAQFGPTGDKEMSDLFPFRCPCLPCTGH